MKISGTIYTTKQDYWVKKCLPDIYKTILTAKGVEVDAFKIVEIKIPKSFKTRTSGRAVRPDWDWVMDQYKTDGTVLCIHITRRDHDKLGLRHPNGGRLGGTYNRNFGDNSMEFLVVADSYSRFKQVFLHELSHGFSQWIGTKDMTHFYDYTKHNIASIYKKYDFTVFNKSVLKWKMLVKIRDLLLKQVSQKKPTPRFDKKYPISQDYGVQNSHYKLTGRHIGRDYACPVGTDIHAPVDGEITVCGVSKVLGKHCEFVYTYKGKKYTDRILHLSKVPTVGSYKKGDVIAVSGNTGDSTGPHCHIDTWKGSVQLQNINADNWDKLTVDPEHLY